MYANDQNQFRNNTKAYFKKYAVQYSCFFFHINICPIFNFELRT